MRESFPHHLIDIISPEQDFDLGLFLEETDRAVKLLEKRNKFPLFVGGSMLFHKTLLEGIHDFPNDLNIRKDIEALKKSKGLDVLVQELKSSDPETHQVN